MPGVGALGALGAFMAAVEDAAGAALSKAVFHDTACTPPQSRTQELEAARGQLASTQQALSEANAALRHSRDHQEALARDPLHPQSQSHTQSHASLHVGAMQAEASGSSLGGGSTLSTGPALSIFNDGSAAGLSHENRVLRERVAALEGQLGSWQDERAAAEQVCVWMGWQGGARMGGCAGAGGGAGGRWGPWASLSNLVASVVATDPRLHWPAALPGAPWGLTLAMAPQQPRPAAITRR